MNFRALLFSIIFSLIVTPVFAASNANAPGATTSRALSHESPEQKQKDSEIIGVIISLDNNEISAAQEAGKKKVGPAVAKYAKFLYTQHTQNLREAKNLAHTAKLSAAESSQATSLAEQGKTELENLSPMNNEDFQNAYIDAMVKDHTAALELIDTDLLKNATDPKLIKFLKNTRMHIAAHLKAAEKIQAKIKKS